MKFQLLLSILLIIGCSNNQTKKNESPLKLIPITTKNEKAKELFLEARFFVQNGLDGDLQKHYEEAIELDPTFVRMHNFLSIYSPNDSIKRSAHLLAKKYQHLASKEEQMLVEASEYRLSHPDDILEKKLFELAKLCPDDKYLYHTISFLLFRKNPSLAIKAGEATIAIDSSYGSGYNILGYAYMNNKQLNKAETTFDNYIKYTPNDGNPLDSKADLMMKMERYPEALELKKKAFEMDTSLFWIPEEIPFIEAKIDSLKNI